MAPSGPMTAEELLHLSIPGKCAELVRGMLVVREPPGFQHGVVAARLMMAIGGHVAAHRLGVVLAAETGFTLFRGPDTVRAPDVAFVSRARLPDPIPPGYAEMAPDLAVEVLSPGDRPGEVFAKVADWLSAGCLIVWIVDPVRRTARVYRADGTDAHIEEGGVLDGEGVLPGFSLPLSASLG